MVISNRLATIPDSYFGKTMGRKVEHGSLPLINMAVEFPMEKHLKVLLTIFLKRYVFLRIKSMVLFTGKSLLKKPL